MYPPYKNGCEVPHQMLINRLRELAEAVTKGRDIMNNEFTMSSPALHHRDADLVLSEAADRLEAFYKSYDSCPLTYETTNRGE